MKTRNSKLTVTAGAILAALALTAVGQESTVKDSYFEPDTDKLRELPANLVVLRESHFPDSSPKIRHVHDEEGKAITRTLGRNVSLREVIGEAYDCNPMQVVLPAEPPKSGFDFLVTTGSDAREQLQKALRKELGYAVHRETRNTDVLLLTTENSNLPGLTPSGEDEKPDITYEEGKLHFTHQPLSVLLNGLSEGLRQPVVNRTGLSKYYNFSVPWSPEIEKAMHTGAFDPEGIKKFLADRGLKLERDTVPLEVLVVEKAR